MPFLIPYITLKSNYIFLSPCLKKILSFVHTYIATPTNHYPPPKTLDMQNELRRDRVLFIYLVFVNVRHDSFNTP